MPTSKKQYTIDSRMPGDHEDKAVAFTLSSFFEHTVSNSLNFRLRPFAKHMGFSGPVAEVVAEFEPSVTDGVWAGHRPGTDATRHRVHLKFDAGGLCILEEHFDGVRPGKLATRAKMFALRTADMREDGYHYRLLSRLQREQLSKTHYRERLTRFAYTFEKSRPPATNLRDVHCDIAGRVLRYEQTGFGVEFAPTIEWDEIGRLKAAVNSKTFPLVRVDIAYLDTWEATYRLRGEHITESYEYFRDDQGFLRARIDVWEHTSPRGRPRFLFDEAGRCLGENDADGHFRNVSYMLDRNSNWIAARCEPGRSYRLYENNLDWVVRPWGISQRRIIYGNFDV